MSSEFAFFDPVQVREEVMDKQVLEVVSNGDYSDDMDDKIDCKLYQKNKDKPGFFESREYFRQIFPSAQI